jgi:hypothetical protein
VQDRADAPRDVHGPTLASSFHWDRGDEQRLATGIFTAMRTAFQARWIELGFAGVPIPSATIMRLREIARSQAASTVRTHNTSVTRFILGWLQHYAAAHDGSTNGSHDELLDAVEQWLLSRAATHGAGMATSQTLLAQSLADLTTGNRDSRYVVDGPPLTDKSCATCVQYVGHVLTHEQAWNLIFPAHPHCNHVLRRLSADEVAPLT